MYPYRDLSSSSEALEQVKQGIPPEIPPEIRESKRFDDQIMVKAIGMCMKKDPAERANAREVANVLEEALQKSPLISMAS
jgi:hypothetical protein